MDDVAFSVSQCHFVVVPFVAFLDAVVRLPRLDGMFGRGGFGLIGRVRRGRGWSFGMRVVLPWRMRDVVDVVHVVVTSAVILEGAFS